MTRIKNIHDSKEKIPIAASALEKLLKTAELMEDCEFRAVCITGIKDGIIRDLYIPKQTAREVQVQSDGISWVMDGAVLKSIKKLTVLGVAHGHGRCYPEHSATDHDNFNKVLEEWCGNNVYRDCNASGLQNARVIAENKSTILHAGKGVGFKIELPNDKFSQKEIDKLMEYAKIGAHRRTISQVSSIVVNRKCREIHGIKRFREEYYFALPKENRAFPITDERIANFTEEQKDAGWEYCYTVHAAVEPVDVDAPAWDVDALIGELKDKITVKAACLPKIFRKNKQSLITRFFGREPAQEIKEIEPEIEPPKNAVDLVKATETVLEYLGSNGKYAMDLSALFSATAENSQQPCRIQIFESAIEQFISGHTIPAEPAQKPASETAQEITGAKTTLETRTETTAPGIICEREMPDPACAAPTGINADAAPDTSAKTAEYSCLSQKQIADKMYRQVLEHYTRAFDSQDYAKLKRNLASIKGWFEQMKGAQCLKQEHQRGLEAMIGQKENQVGTMRTVIEREATGRYDHIRIECENISSYAYDPDKTADTCRSLLEISRKFDMVGMEDKAGEVLDLIARINPINHNDRQYRL
jgi:hypothetical protein